MNENAELLNHIYKNSQIGLHSMELLKERINDPNFLAHCNAQMGKYGTIHRRAEEILHDSGHDDRTLRQISKAPAGTAILLENLRSDNLPHAAEIMMQGSTQGVIETTKNIKRCRDANPDILLLATELLQTEENNAQQMRSFL
jgi:hypothetical protein